MYDIDDIDFPNQTIQRVFLENNQYYSGYYLNDDNIYVLCITNESSQSLIDQITSDGVVIQLVIFSYSELIGVYDILTQRMEDYNLQLVGIDVENNRVTIQILTDESVPDAIQDYVQNGIVYIEPSSNIVTG